jgi:hydroxymethylbilane synthase
MMILRIGTRGSPLAMAQAHETRDRLMAAHGLEASQMEIVVIATSGDQIRDRPLYEIGGKGLFTKEIEDALLDGSIDLAVHSMKDMPANLPQGLAFAAILPREDARDAFLSLSAPSLLVLPEGAVLGSSSVRRTAQALRLRPDLKTVQFRGNVQTRLRKLGEGVADATFLACAGLQRLGLAQHITAVMEIDQMLPAIAQGAIAIEIKSDNDRLRAMLDTINHAETAVCVSCERAFLKALDGSCRTPLAGHAVLTAGNIHFKGEALTDDGSHVFATSRVGPLADAEAMGREAGEEIKAKGGSLIAFS